MSEYIPREYWPARLAREGRKYVGRSGMDDNASERQAGQFLAHLLPHIPDDCEDLLDYGCGPGRMAVRLAAACDRYTGVDICQQALVHNCRLIYLEEDSLPFSAGQFDCVVAVTVIQHIVAPDQFKLWMDELNRVADAGCIFLIIDNHKEGDGTAHVLARTPEVVAEALGCEIVRSEVISVEKKDSHFFMVGRKI